MTMIREGDAEQAHAPRAAVPTTIGGGATTVELAHQVVGHRRQSNSLKLAGLASDLADRSCLVPSRSEVLVLYRKRASTEGRAGGQGVLARFRYSDLKEAAGAADAGTMGFQSSRGIVSCCDAAVPQTAKDGVDSREVDWSGSSLRFKGMPN